MNTIGQTAKAIMELVDGDRATREVIESEILKLAKDAERFLYLQNLPVVEAQAYFWNYGSRTERAKAIDKAMRGGEIK